MFKRSVAYFYNPTSFEWDADGNFVSLEGVTSAVNAFITKYNCAHVAALQYTCSDEDFLMIQLQCPDAVSSYGKVS